MCLCVYLTVQEWDEQEEEKGKKYMDEQESNDEDGNPVEKMAYTKQEFNLTEFDVEFDQANPTIDIPNEVATHIDNDFDLPYTAPDFTAE